MPKALKHVVAKFHNHLRRAASFLWYNPMVLTCIMILFFAGLIALIAPYITGDPLAVAPVDRLKPPSAQYWFGTDFLGRDIFARTLHGTRISLVVGLSSTMLSTLAGLFVGLIAGYIRLVDAIAMRIMDGLMAIPGLLLAIALMSLFGSSIPNVVIAISIPQVPGIARLVRSLVLSIRQQPFVEAAECIGTRMAKILVRHIFPNVFAPLIVQASFVFASSIITEAILSFLGAGIPPEIPSWGNMVAEGRLTFLIAPWEIFIPGTCLAVLVLTINLLGDSLRDILDPRIGRKLT